GVKGKQRSFTCCGGRPFRRAPSSTLRGAARRGHGGLYERRPAAPQCTTWTQRRELRLGGERGAIREVGSLAGVRLPIRGPTGTPSGLAEWPPTRFGRSLR